MTQDEIMAVADMAETWPGSGALNWNEVPFGVLAAWVAKHPGNKAMPTRGFDVESVKDMFQTWWSKQSEQEGKR